MTKLAGLFAAVLLALLCLIIRIVYINVTSGNEYKMTVLSQAQQEYISRVLPARRGDITDRNGNLLATSKKVYNLVLDCNAVNTEMDDKQPYRDPTVKALVKLMGVEEEEILKRLNGTNTRKSQYEVLKREVTSEEKAKWEEHLDTSNFPDDPEEYTAEQKEILNIKGIWFEETYVRSYPYGSLACDTIGFTYDRDTADWGIEGYYNSTLLGTDGRRFGNFNENSEVEQTIIEPTAGYNVVTTLDLGLQQIVEKYVNAFNEVLGCENIGVIIEDPNTGEILAMDGGDRYNLNNPRDMSNVYTEAEIAAMSDEETVEALNMMWNNYCISSSFEPGSTVKPLIMAAALEKGIITEDDSFICDGGEHFGDTEDTLIKCSVYPDMHMECSLGNVIAYSCNDGMMQIGALMGAEQMIKSQTLLNFGSRTGIDLPNESAGILWEEDIMGPVELATASFGQGFTCSMIQEINGLCSVINGGYYYQPHVVSAIEDANGNTVQKIGTTLLKQTISSSISADIREYMGECVTYGTGTLALVPGYTMGGKTGTAEKLPRDNGKYLVSYIGFAPLDDPEIVIYVVIDEVHVMVQDRSAYAMYVAQGILSEALPYLNKLPDDAELGFNPQMILWEGFNGHLRDTNIQITMDDEGFFKDADGHMVDSEGNRIDSEGYLLNDYGDYMLNGKGEKIKTEATVQADMSFAESLVNGNGESLPLPPEDEDSDTYDFYDMGTLGFTNEEAGLE